MCGVDKQLEECPRTQLEIETVQYCDTEVERKQYEMYFEVGVGDTDHTGFVIIFDSGDPPSLSREVSWSRFVRPTCASSIAFDERGTISMSEAKPKNDQHLIMELWSLCFPQGGRVIRRATGQPLSTEAEGWIFVLRDNAIFANAKKTDLPPR